MVAVNVAVDEMLSIASVCVLVKYGSSFAKALASSLDRNRRSRARSELKTSPFRWAARSEFAVRPVILHPCKLNETRREYLNCVHKI